MLDIVALLLSTSLAAEAYCSRSCTPVTTPIFSFTVPAGAKVVQREGEGVDSRVALIDVAGTRYGFEYLLVGEDVRADVDPSPSGHGHIVLPDPDARGMGLVVDWAGRDGTPSAAQIRASVQLINSARRLQLVRLERDGNRTVAILRNEIDQETRAHDGAEVSRARGTLVIGDDGCAFVREVVPAGDGSWTMERVLLRGNADRCFRQCTDDCVISFGDSPIHSK